uniref:Uncharacterized protein n=2 Tax=Rhinopithecus TaxID=542827 RepID=A0A2K6LNY0_RHIBE
VGPHLSLWTPEEGYLAQQAQKNFSSPFAPSLQFERIREFPAVANSYYLAVAGRRVWFHGSKSSINQVFWETVKKGCSTAAAMGGAHTQPCTRPHTHTLFVLGPVSFAPQVMFSFPPIPQVIMGLPTQGYKYFNRIKALNQRNRALKTVEFQASASGKGVFKLRGNEAFFGAPEITSCRQLLIC